MGRPTRRFARTAVAAAVAVALVVLGATPAGADPAGPSDYRSEVTEIEPAVEGVTARILGGDSFLELRVAPGITVVVEGYSGEPYLRFRADGAVERNRLSSATYLNDDRQGQVTIPAEVQAAMADATSEPDWEVVASGGTYAWHDHRTHWMGKVPPPVDRGERVPGAYDPWRVPIEVDGEPAEVRGTLVYADAVSPLPWAALGLVAAAALAWVLRGRGLRLPAAVLAVVSAVAVAVGRAEWAITPHGTGNPLLWVLPAIALVTAVVALGLGDRAAAVVVALASIATLSGWALLRLQVLTKPELATDLPYALDRATVTVALAVCVASTYAALTSGALALSSLDDDEPDLAD